MIADWETNKVYFSYLLTYDFPDELKELRRILAGNDISHGSIAGTKDFFCRDYMPVQVSKNNFVQFAYRPDYLLNDPKKVPFVTKIESVSQKNAFYRELNITKSELILDGGNVIKSKDKVIITDKVFKDNSFPEKEIINKLEKVLDASVIIIPGYPGEVTGHADGLIRFVDENTVLTINLKNENREWVSLFRKSLKDRGLQIESLPAGKNPDTDWRYINYLHVKDLIIIPIFEDNDDIMISFLHNFFEQRGKTVKELKASKIAENDGILHCFTWNILI